MLRTLTMTAAIGTLAHAHALAQSPAFESKTGKELYAAACAACHGPDGKGQPRTVVGFDTELPDFTGCSFSTPEQDTDWMAIVREGGPTRAFDRKMPAFGDALSGAAVQRILDYVRGFCGSRAWPRGELNLPRALVTEKAFPENEALVTTTISGGDTRGVGNDFLYERRLGARSQFEVVVPVEIHSVNGNGWQQGIGDVAIAVKHAAFHDVRAGSIVSVGAEVALPTGKERSGFGKGVTVFEPFVAIGQILPSDGFFQLHAGAELPARSEKAAKEVFWRAAIGKSFVAPRFGRTWSPIIEFLGARELVRGEPAQWDLVPQMQVSLSRRQHIVINAGVRVPLTDRGERNVQVLTYFLWDWFDGGLLEGWR